VVQGREIRSENLERITRSSVLSRGLGRSYGDSSLPSSSDHLVSGTPLADRFLSFDPETGVLHAEAGLCLERLNRVFLPKGWFTPVTPGTQFVTLGGMVAADVHGKNHHVRGCFGEHVTALKIRVADGSILECSDEQERDLFRATLGGMGLTGHILEVEFRMQRIPSPWIWQESERVESLEALIHKLEQAGESWPYTVSWADCMNRGPSLGRGTLIKGRWAEPGETPSSFRYERPTFSVPFSFPNWFVSPFAVKTFNRLNYWRHGSRVRRSIVHPVTFFYPLDVIHEWNRLYGRRGFTQYQCVLPVSGSLAAHRELLETAVQGGGAYLCVIKDCGHEGKGMISFPRPGVSFALDFAVGPGTQELVDRLNEIVIRKGGRVYLAKDAFTRAEHFRAMEPRLDAWLQVRRRWDPGGKFRSAQSVRVLGDQP
jgi:FAD/FMN-containing dehydrogenase